jgi:hypothetical protein
LDLWIRRTEHEELGHVFSRNQTPVEEAPRFSFYTPPQQSPEQDIQLLTNEPPKEPKPKSGEQKQKEPEQKPPREPKQKPTEPEQKETEMANEEAKEYKELGIGKPNVFDGN